MPGYRNNSYIVIKYSAKQLDYMTLNPLPVFMVLLNFARFALSCCLPLSEKHLNLKKQIWMVSHPKEPHCVGILPVG